MHFRCRSTYDKGVHDLFWPRHPSHMFGLQGPMKGDDAQPTSSTVRQVISCCGCYQALHLTDEHLKW